jgi:hypothetical protein
MDVAQQRIQRWVQRGRTNSWLNLSGLRLRELPELPPTVRRLNISQNKLTDLSGLPRGLRKLYCGMNNKLLQFPADMPHQLIHVSCVGCFRLQSLDTLPDSVKYLDATHCETLCEILKFPRELRTCNLYNVYRLSYIREFSPKLLTLSISETSMYDLPQFPTSLIALDVTFVKFRIQTVFPPKLQYLAILGYDTAAYVTHDSYIFNLLPPTLLFLELKCSDARWTPGYIKSQLPLLEYYRCRDHTQWIGDEPTNIYKYLYPRV